MTPPPAHMPLTANRESRDPAELVRAIDEDARKGRIAVPDVLGVAGTIARFCLHNDGVSLSASDALALCREVLAHRERVKRFEEEALRFFQSRKEIGFDGSSVESLATLLARVDARATERAAADVKLWNDDARRLSGALLAIHEAAESVPASVLRRVAYDAALNCIDPNTARFQIERRAAAIRAAERHG